MHVRQALPIVCAALLVGTAPAAAQEAVQPTATATVSAAPAAEVTDTVATPTVAAVPDITAAPVATEPPPALPEASATAAPTATATPAPTAEPAATREASPTPRPTPSDAPAAPPPAPPAVATSARQQPTPEATATATATAAPSATPTPPSPCALKDERSGACRAPSTVCTIFGTDGDDLLIGTPFNDVLCGFGGNDRLEGRGGDDELIGGDGNDTLIGGEGEDCMLGGPGDDSADTTLGEPAEVEHSADGEPSNIGLDEQGHCNSAVKGTDEKPQPESQNVPPRPRAATASTTLVSTAAPVSARLRLGLPDTKLTVHDGAVRIRVTCSATTPALLVINAGTEHIAQTYFTCRAPESTVRVRLNATGRKLVAHDDRVSARVNVAAAGQTIATDVQLVSRGG